MCDGCPFASRFFFFSSPGGARPFLRFPFPMSPSLCNFFDSLPDRVRRSILAHGESSNEWGALMIPCLGDALPASPHFCWEREALEPRQAQQDGAGRDTCGHFPDGGRRCISWNTTSLIVSVFFKEAVIVSPFRTGAYVETFT